MVSTVVVGIIVGVISSIVSSFIFLAFVNNKLPKVKLSNYIIKRTDPETEGPSLAIKFINYSKHSILDVKAILYGVEYSNDEKTLSHLKKITEKSIPFVDKYNAYDQQYRYAIILNLPLNDNSIDKIKDTYEEIRVELIARESYYNTFLTLGRNLNPNKIRTSHIFEIGENLSVRKVT